LLTVRERQKPKKNLKKNNAAMKKAEIKSSKGWRPFTRATNPGENISRDGLGKGAYLSLDHLKGRKPGENTYKKNMVIPQSHKKKKLIWGDIKMPRHKESDIKGDGTKPGTRQAMLLDKAPPINLRIKGEKIFK